MLSVHPRFEIDEDAGVIVEKEGPTTNQLLDSEQESETEDEERTEPDLDVYADALLLVDTLERHEVAVLEELDTDVLVNLYTLLSDVQRNANDLRQEVRAVLLDRLHHDQPVSGPYGSVQRTSHRNRTLKEEGEVLELLSEAGIDRERVTSVDTSKVDEALEVTELAESDVYEIGESEYVRKAEVDQETKETRLQGLKDRLAATDEDTEELQQEIEDLEQRIDDLTSFRSGSSFQSEQSGDDTEVSIDEMMENMSDSVKDIEFPIEGCQYKHRSAASVARHVSGSSTAKHIWENTSYAGWRDFLREHGESPT